MLFVGEFGSGKTTFIQGIAEGLGIEGPVTSPSFTLVWEYRSATERGEMPFYHIDLYRIESVEEALRLGLPDLFQGCGVCAVEWADRVPQAMPEEHLLISLAYLSETKRIVRMQPYGERYRTLAEAFKRSAFRG